MYLPGSSLRSQLKQHTHSQLTQHTPPILRTSFGHPQPTPEDLIHAHFSMAGPVDKIIMGINRNTKMPCGFCFVVYENIASAREAVTMLNGTRLWKVDGSGHGIIRVEVSVASPQCTFE